MTGFVGRKIKQGIRTNFPVCSVCGEENSDIGTKKWTRRGIWRWSLSTRCARVSGKGWTSPSPHRCRCLLLSAGGGATSTACVLATIWETGKKFYFTQDEIAFDFHSLRPFPSRLQHRLDSGEARSESNSQGGCKRCWWTSGQDAAPT